jgi:7-cyano-7-deazaguanine synthase
MSRRSKAVVLVSGGLDSCVTAAIARRDHESAFLHVDYGQRTEARERQAFHALADHWDVRERLCVTIDPLQKVGGSSLTDPRFDVAPADLENPGIPTSYVPFRNAHILAGAVSWGEVIGAESIFIGAVEEDSSGYPDCRPAFYEAFNRVIDLGTRPETSIRIRTPIIHLAKREIVLRGAELEAPFHMTWSCYQREDIACGNCDSCALRLRGFQQAGIQDPLPYAIPPPCSETAT